MTEVKWLVGITDTMDMNLSKHWAAAKVRDLLYAGQTFGVTVRDAANTYSVSGTAIMTAVKHVSTVGNLAQGSFSLKGTGALV